MASAKSPELCFGAYLRFDTPDKKLGAVLAGSDNAVGDIGEIIWVVDEDKNERAWLKNPYGQTIGFLNERYSHHLAVLAAKGWVLRYVLSFTAYSETPEPGVYWGQAAVFAFAPQYQDEFERFLKVFARYAGEGLRPNPSLGTASVEHVLKDPESWKPSGKVKMPKEGSDTVILKDHRTAHDRLLDQGRAKNVGCYIVSWAFIIALVAGLIYLLHTMGLF